ncbi:GNAT family N-acetyltransferase [Flavobacteriaceae bacterium]|nr:GNAT family N-acetyltransferase [Flavobacteriaceae bacterium]
MTKQKYSKLDQDFSFPNLEKEMLQFWQKNKIFETSIENRQEKEDYVFYDGPPFANGLPHYGHLLTGYIKDIFARYNTQKGKKVERKFGWDTHGLPVEMESEKTLGVSGQIAINEYGIEKFNQNCRESVMKYANQWQEYVTRQGRWVDFDNGYKTMDVNYMESVIWAFKELYKKGLMYEDFRVVPYSWACQTPLSNFETKMDNSYREKTSKAVTVKFAINSEKFQNSKILVWTTTPWTLPSNLALAVGKDIYYIEIKVDNEKFIIAEALTKKYQKELGEFEILQKFEGKELIGLDYTPILPFFAKLKNEYQNIFTILHGDFVTTQDGTGIVHLAPGFGEDDQLLCKKHKIPTICPIDAGAKFENPIINNESFKAFDDFEATLPLKGRQVFETNDDIIKQLKKQNSWLKTEQYIHNYPHCWRTDTPLIYKAVSSWYVKVTDFKDRMVELNSGKPFFKVSTDYKGKLSRFETHRIEAFPITDKDLDNLKKMYSDPDVRKYYYFLDQPIMNEDETKNNIAYYKYYFEKHNLPRLVLFDKKTKEFLGTSGLVFYGDETSFEKGKVEISYQLAKSAWGKGFATEICRALTEYSFKKYPIENLYAAAISDNINSHKVLYKGGFKKIRQSKNSYPGSPNPKTDYEEWFFQLSKKNWQKTKEKNSINWIPDHIKNGQFGKWLEGARDWSITRNRFWGCPVPVWKSDNPDFPRLDVYGSLDEIEADFGVRPKDLHRPHIDKLIRPNPDDPSGKSKMVRANDVLDCWFESGSMPYAQAHYPFENKDHFEKNFPADFITEYVAQTRGWFYTLTVLSVALFDKIPFKNVICHGTILDTKGEKLSKRLKNYPDPIDIFSEYGSDAMRFYLLSSPVMRGQEFKIDKDGKSIKDTLRNSIKPLINSYNFFCLYANADEITAEKITAENLKNISSPMDLYILAKLSHATKSINESLANYDTITACEEFNRFFEALNNWYIRRSREIFWQKEKTLDKQNAYDVLYTAIVNMCEISAALLPFTTEKIWQNLQK